MGLLDIDSSLVWIWKEFKMNGKGMGKSSRTGLKLLVDRIHCLLSKGKLYAERVGTEAIDGPSSQSDGVSGCCQRSRNLLTNATRA